MEVKLKFQGRQGISYVVNSFGRKGLTTLNFVLFVFQMLELQYNAEYFFFCRCSTRQLNGNLTFMILYV